VNDNYEYSVYLIDNEQNKIDCNKEIIISLPTIYYKYKQNCKDNIYGNIDFTIQK
jgi:hypothetical protein